MSHRFLSAFALALLAATSLDAYADCTSISISPATALAAATVGTSYSETVSATSAGEPPYVFAITSGLGAASGLAMTAVDAASANLTGTPAQAGQFLVTVTATAADGCSGGRTYALAVAPGDQTIQFTSQAPADARLGGASYTVGASATSALAVNFSIDASASAICSIAGSTVTFQDVGTCVIDANQPGDANWNAAPQAQQSFAVARGSQTITFTSTPPAAAAVGGATYDVAATASSGLAVAFTIDASASSVCSIAGTTVSFLAAGSCVIDANQAGDGNYDAAPQVQQSFAVGRSNQTITFTSTAPTAAAVGGAAYDVSATASSGLAVAFSIDASASAVCSIAGTTVTFQGAGACVIDANQPGDTNYNAAPQVQQSFAVARGNQTITFTSAPPAATVDGATYTVAATASSGLAVAFSIDAGASAVCSIAGATVSFHAAGTCVIDANQSGDANYNAAPQAQQSFGVAPGSQTITFTSTAPADAAVAGPTYTVTASASSGLAVTLTIDASATAVCTIAGGVVSFQSAGTCVIDADQAGDANYNAAPQAQQSFAVAPGNQTIAFTSTAPAGAVVAGATYTVTASATSGLAVTFSIDAVASGVCTIAGSTISFIGAGTCTIDANQAGDANWNPAPQAQQSFAVGKASQTITFTSTAPANASVGGSYAVAATATSGLPVAFSIDASASGICSIAGATVSFVTAGTCVIDANQPGDANWNAAPQVQQSFAISPCISLNVGQVVLGSMPGAANVCVTNNDAAPAEFTYLPINIGTTSNASLSVTGTNIIAVTGPPTPIAPAAANSRRASLASLASAPDENDFDPHTITAPSALPSDQSIDASMLVEPDAITAGPMTVGQLIDLNASIGACGATTDIRKGRVEAITTAQSPGQQVLYAVQEVVETPPGSGTWVPALAGGFAQVDFQNIIDAFVQAPPGSTAGGSGAIGSLLKTGGLDLITGNFGTLSDIDGNNGVIVFFTKKMNELSPPATGSPALGLFQPRDLLSQASCPGSNAAEMIYMLMPDPVGAVNSNVRTLSLVYGSAGPTLVHHFEHLANASRRLYFNGAAPLEEAWLDEGLAFSVQELAFFNASVGLGPRGNIQLSTLTTGPNASVRVSDFNTYENPMFGTMRTFFYQTAPRVGPLRQQPFSVGSTPDVHEVIAPNFSITYAFLRYAIDRKNTGDAALFNALVNTSSTGMANLQNAFGVDPNAWARDFLVAVYADDAGIANLDATYTLPSWNFRSVYGGLGGFPLATNPLTDGTPLAVPLTFGGGARYLRFGVTPGQSATILTTEGGVTPTSPITTAIVRTK